MMSASGQQQRYSSVNRSWILSDAPVAFLRVLVIIGCLLAIRASWKFIHSDALFQRGTPESTRAAIRVEPDCWWCYIQLARLDESNAKRLLQTSLEVNRYNAEAAIDLALRYEADGDFRRAEGLLLQAFEVDRTFAPRWSLANFYFRRDNLPAFWAWARRSAEMPAQDVGALFELCWHVSPDPEFIRVHVLNNNPDLLRDYVKFLIGKGRPEAAAVPAVHLVQGDSQVARDFTDRAMVLDLVDRLIAANDAVDALAVWHELATRRWIVAESSFPNNPDFQREPVPVKFDWNLSAYGGLHSWPGSSGLRTEFAGDEPESCMIAEQTISLAPGTYRLESTYRTRGIAANTGIRWEITDARTDALVANSGFLSSDSLAHVGFLFQVKPDSPLLRLRLAYHREPGTTRVNGLMVVPSVSIQPAS